MLTQDDLKAGSIVECVVLNKTYRLLALKDASVMNKDTTAFILSIMWITPDFGDIVPRYVLHQYPAINWTKLC